MIYYFLIYQITKKHMDTGKETINMIKTDIGTTQYFLIFFIVILASLVYNLFYTNYMTFEYLDILWIIFIIFSGVLEYNAILNLKDNYYPQIGPEKKLITSGIYKIIRHPIYLSAIILGFGIIMLLARPIWYILLPIIIISIIIKVEIEDKYLTKRFKGYNKYKKRSYKLIPFIY